MFPPPALFRACAYVSTPVHNLGSLLLQGWHLHKIVDFLRNAPFGSISAAISIAAVAWSVRATLWSKWRQWLDRRFLRNRIGAELFTPDEILAAIKWYVEPDCQNIDPSGGEEWRRTAAVRQGAFSQLDRLFSNSDYRHSILLADSGMGKTSLLLNYYAQSRSRKRQMSLAIVPLGYPRHDQVIQSIPNKGNTVILLDAFDEDTKAANDHRARLTELLDMTSEFRNVLITCRTQFFRTDDEIPKETGIVRFGPTKAGQEHEYIFYKLYLSPFNDGQIRTFLRRRWPMLQRPRRLQARQICEQLGDLTVRPLVLTHLDALIGKDRLYKYTFQIYEEIINSWLKREAHRVNVAHLRTFSECLAVEIYSRRQALGGERLPASQAESLARDVSLSLEELQIRVRSLLNRDAEGRLKFAHRSIMEYLYIRAFIKRPRKDQPQWTDQMRKMFLEIALHGSADEIRDARTAAVHTDQALRQELITRIVSEQPESLVRFPMSIGTTRFLRDNEFLLIMGNADGTLFAASKRTLPHDFIASIPENLEVADLAIPVLESRGGYHIKLQSHRHVAPELYHSAAFGPEWAGPTWTPSPAVDSPDYRKWERRERCVEFVLIPKNAWTEASSDDSKTTSLQSGRKHLRAASE